MQMRLQAYWHNWRRRRQARLAKKAAAPGLYHLLKDGIHPIDWMLYEGRISQIAHTLALEWLNKGYLCRRLPPQNVMFEQQGYDLWLELTVRGRRVLKRRYGGT